MEIQLVLTALVVSFRFAYVQPKDQISTAAVTIRPINGESQIQENFRNLFDSITKNDMKKTKTFRNFLEDNAEKEQRAFDTIKEKIQAARQRNSDKQKNLYNHNEYGHTAAYKRATSEDPFGLRVESDEVKAFSKQVSALSKIWSPRTESNPIRDQDDLKQRASEAAVAWSHVEKALFTRTTERDYEKEAFVKKKRTGSMAFSQIPDCVLDTSGVFKYILVELTDVNGKKRNIVRGHKRFAYHDDIFQDLRRDLDERFSVKCRCLGGGRIDHHPDEKFIKVYGYSEGYGQANHKESVEIIKTEYKDYQVVWTNEGY